MTEPMPDDFEQPTASSTVNVATLEPSTSKLTVSTEMKKGTDFSKEAKTVSTYLSIAMPDVAFIQGANGLVLDPLFIEGVKAAASQLLQVTEVLCATQHGLSVSSDAEGVVRVLDLFPGATSTPAAQAAPAAPQGAFRPPQQGEVVPQPVAAVAIPDGAKWGDLNDAQKGTLATQINNWLSAGMPNSGGVYNNTLYQGQPSKYPNVKCSGVSVYTNTIINNTQLFSPEVRAWAAQFPVQGR